MSIIVECILPLSLFGCERDVVYINTNQKLDIFTLVEVIESKLKRRISSSEHNCRSFIDRSFLDPILDHFHLFNSTSISDCCMALMSILHFPCMYDNLGAIIIDDVCTLGGETKVHVKKDAKLGDCVDILKQLRQEREIVVILSQFPPLFSDGHYIKPWLKLVKNRFKVEAYTEDMQMIHRI